MPSCSSTPPRPRWPASASPRRFATAGLPEGLFANLFLSHEQTARLLGSGLVDHATFTGSVEGGRAVERAAAGSFTTLTLELGGKDPAYVREDADVAGAVEGLVDGSFYNSGQSCCGVERIYVHEAVWQPFLDGFVEAASRYRLGDPLDPETSLGPMASAKGAASVREQVRQAIEAGASAHLPPQLFPADTGDGPYLMPQVLTGVDHGMAVMREETFGPVGRDHEGGGRRGGGAADERQRLRPHRLDLDPRPRGGRAAGAAGRGGDGLRQPLRLSRSRASPGPGVKDSGRGASLGRYGFESVTRPKSLHLRSA